MQIPLTVPFFSSEEKEALLHAFDEGKIIGNGTISKRVQEQVQQLFGVKHVLLTPSCTAALEMSMLALDIGPGDEVIMPSFTFVSAANCVVLRGATPIFAEIKPDTLNIDPEDIRRCITPRTKVIMPMHYAGVGCDMDEIMKIAKEHNLYVVEDAAQGVDALYQDQYLGTIGDIGCYSFHGTKNITCGEGGAFLTNDDEIARKAEIIQEKGTNRAAFIKGRVDKYSWVSVGSSYVLSDLLAAVLEAQLVKRSDVKQARELIYNRYINDLSSLAAREIIQLPVIPDGRESNYHLFFFRVTDKDTRDELLDRLRKRGIGASFHYVPLHSSPFGKELIPVPESRGLSLTEKISNGLIRLPIYPDLKPSEIEYIIYETTKLIRD